jgi:hypothetical protein
MPLDQRGASGFAPKRAVRAVNARPRCLVDRQASQAKLDRTQRGTGHLTPWSVHFLWPADPYFYSVCGRAGAVGRTLGALHRIFQLSGGQLSRGSRGDRQQNHKAFGARPSARFPFRKPSSASRKIAYNTLGSRMPTAGSRRARSASAGTVCSGEVLFQTWRARSLAHPLVLKFAGMRSVLLSNR